VAGAVGLRRVARAAGPLSEVQVRESELRGRSRRSWHQPVAFGRFASIGRATVATGASIGHATVATGAAIAAGATVHVRCAAARARDGAAIAARVMQRVTASCLAISCAPPHDFDVYRLGSVTSPT